ncbi:MAG: DNA gyrase inhibitor YacG [Deltaproteobacteria bacterium]|nr:MAG: DNA gyrase inhibitor YacG [Deltaproteobacteria bacterium]TNF31532.1 MAG: DNA gyrase inhibitor YacG [Deltaproteobacteria bacterium]
MTKVLEVKCPQCEGKFNYYSSEFRPFCCERCKMIDLGHWFSENYAVASNEPLKEQDIDEIQKKLEEEYEG